jgi:pimeloyl-ACP methyl ester carboxylesterase
VLERPGRSVQERNLTMSSPTEAAIFPHATRCVTSRDGARIVFDIAGSGPALVLIHGLSEFRELWTNYGWLEALSSRYTVIAPDLRGAGDSAAVGWPEVHRLGRYIEDFHAVLDAIGAANAAVWGWSFGGFLALQIAARSERVRAAIASGTHFGRVLAPDVLAARLANVDKQENAVRTGEWIGIEERIRRTAQRTDFGAARARLRAAAEWPPIEPGDISLPALVLTGTYDVGAVFRLQDRLAEIEGAGIGLHEFTGLNHVQLVSERETVQPIVERFLGFHVRS